MSDDTNGIDRRGSAGSWLKGQLSLPNILALAGVLFAGVSWQKATDARNEIQDLKIAAIERRMEASDGTFVRQDNLRLELRGIADKLESVEKKVDNINRAVR